MNKRPQGSANGKPNPHPLVIVQVDEGSTDFAYSGLVTLAIKPGTGFPGVALDGVPALNVVSGVATFNNVSIPTASVGYVLLATGQSLTGVESTAFDITPFTFTTADVIGASRRCRWAT